VSGIDAEIRVTTVVFLSDLDDRVPQLVPENQRSIKIGRSDDAVQKV
jgi:hypothetical protein